MLVLYAADETPPIVCRAAERFAQGGGRVFMDIRSFAQSQGTKAVAVNVGRVQNRPVEQQMKAGLRVVVDSPVTAGFEVGQVMPRAAFDDGSLMVLPKDFQAPDLEVLAVAPSGEAGLVRKKIGRGSIVAADVLSLREPFCPKIQILLWRAGKPKVCSSVGMQAKRGPAPV